MGSGALVILLVQTGMWVILVEMDQAKSNARQALLLSGVHCHNVPIRVVKNTVRKTAQKDSTSDWSPLWL